MQVLRGVLAYTKVNFYLDYMLVHGGVLAYGK